MYLYEENCKEIKVYSYAPINRGRNVREFRKQEMAKIPEAKRVFRAETNDKSFPLHPEILKREYTIEELNYEKRKFLKTLYHKISEYKNFWDSGYFLGLEYFYDGSFNNCQMIEVKNNDVIENWLITENYTVYGDIFKLERIINIPPILKDLYLLENHRFNELSNKQLKFFCDLYKFRDEPVEVYNKTIIRDMVHDGVIKRICGNDSDIIQRLRKIYK